MRCTIACGRGNNVDETVLVLTENPIFYPVIIRVVSRTKNIGLEHNTIRVTDFYFGLTINTRSLFVFLFFFFKPEISRRGISDRCSAVMVYFFSRFSSLFDRGTHKRIPRFQNKLLLFCVASCVRIAIYNNVPARFSSAKRAKMPKYSVII